MQRTACAPLLVVACLTLFGCATLPNAKRDPRDPWERMNRTTYRVNDAVDHAITRPIAVTYRRITPQFVQTGVSNFVDNFEYPITIVNDLLQAKFKPFFQDIGRLVINTTVGVGGLFDPATAAGLDKNNEDFGQTMGRWGMHPGPYLVIPLLGPSDVRDALGRVPDSYLFAPQSYINDWRIRYGLWGLELLDTRAHLLDTEKALEGVYDRYAFIRNAYLQRRRYLVTDGRESDEQQDEQQYEEEQKIFEESEGGDQPDAGAVKPRPDQPKPQQDQSKPPPTATPPPD
ncbi:MAG: MlaA family lipoprotein [Steroidobacteraceae bacterium]